MIDPNEYVGSGNVWDLARREYLAGTKATMICQRYGMSLSSFRLHARAGGWRRIDQPECGVMPEDGEFHRDDEVGVAELASQVFLNIRRAIATGRSAEASSWMRLYDRMVDRGRDEVMADLPDAPPPVAPGDAEPILLLTASEEPEDAPTPDELDSLDSVFSESNPPDEITASSAKFEGEVGDAGPSPGSRDADPKGGMSNRSSG